MFCHCRTCGFGLGDWVFEPVLEVQSDMSSIVSYPFLSEYAYNNTKAMFIILHLHALYF